MFYLHLVHQGDGLYMRHKSAGVPSVGDELRFGGEGREKYGRVNRVVWCFDEDSDFGQRVNVGFTWLAEGWEG